MYVFVVIFCIFGIGNLLGHRFRWLTRHFDPKVDVSRSLAKNIKIIAFCGNEIDIIRDWLKYYGFLFGFRNIYVVENYSQDGTFEVLEYYQKRFGLNLSRERKYIKKGETVTKIIRSFKSKDVVAFPVDIDEFVVYLPKNVVLGSNRSFLLQDPEIIQQYILNITQFPAKIYQMDYIIANDFQEVYTRPIHEMSQFSAPQKYTTTAKCFFRSHNLRLVDHGNHGHQGLLRVLEGHVRSDLYLLHYFSRGYKHLEEKTVFEARSLGREHLSDKKLKAAAQNFKTFGVHKLQLFLDYKKGTLKEKWLAQNAWQPEVNAPIIQKVFERAFLDQLYG